MNATKGAQLQTDVYVFAIFSTTTYRTLPSESTKVEGA